MRWGALAVLAACGRVGFDVRPDAAGDAIAAGDGRAQPFCTTVTATFCDDFDEGQALSRWTNINMFGGSLAVDSSNALSLPDAMAVSIDAVAASTTADADGTTPVLAANASRISAQFDVAFDVIGTGDPVVFELDVDDGTQTHAIELVERTPPGLAYIEDIIVPDTSGMPQYTYDQLVEIDPGAWHHIAIDLVAGTGSQLVVAIDGTQLVDVVPSAANGGMASARAGTIYLAGPAQPWQLHLDNIAVTAQ